MQTCTHSIFKHNCTKHTTIVPLQQLGHHAHPHPVHTNRAHTKTHPCRNPQSPKPTCRPHTPAARCHRSTCVCAQRRVGCHTSCSPRGPLQAPVASSTARRTGCCHPTQKAGARWAACKGSRRGNRQRRRTPAEWQVKVFNGRWLPVNWNIQVMAMDSLRALGQATALKQQQSSSRACGLSWIGNAHA